MFFSETALPKWTDIWWEAPMEGAVWSFLKAEWKVSDTGSAHWASSSLLNVLQVSLEMPVPSQGHYGFHSFPVVDWFCLFI